MLVFAEGGKLENPEKNPRSKARAENKVNPYMPPGQISTWTTLMGGAIPVSWRRGREEIVI